MNGADVGVRETHLSADARLAIYQAVASRRNAYDALLWQIPALSLTAQAFLFATVLASASSRTSQIIASVLATSVSIASLLALRRFRVGQHTDSLLLERIEESLGASAELGFNPHTDVGERGVEYGRLMKIPPVLVWQLVLICFLIASLVLLANAIFSLGLTDIRAGES